MSTASSTTSSSCPVSLPSFCVLLPSVSSPSDLSPGGASRGPYGGLNVVRGRRKKRKVVRAKDKRNRQATTISELPDDVLLEIFVVCKLDHHMNYENGKVWNRIWEWHMLVHICRRWRQVIFASPLRLSLQIFCTHGTPVRKRLNIWPTFPIVINYWDVDGKPSDEDNIIAALEHPSRVCGFKLFGVTGPQLGRIATAMQESFPALTYLCLWSGDSDVPVLPGEFLGGSTPRLQELSLYGIPFPALLVLLPSASNLVKLSLRNIPQTGYITPEAMVAALATLTRLRDLSIEFRSPYPRPGQIRMPPTPTTRTVLPALTSLSFRGVREYLEDFVSRIDAPRLDETVINYFNQLIDFAVPQFSRFIDRSETHKRPMRCSVKFSCCSVTFSAYTTSDEPESSDFFRRRMEVRIACEQIDWQVSHLAHLLSHISVVPTYAVHLSIDSDSITRDPENMVDVEWLQLLSQFPSAQTLFVSKQFAGDISRALKNSAASGVMVTAEVLPALHMLCLRGQPESSVKNFISSRRDSGRSVTFVNTKTKFEEILESYEEEIREMP